MANGFSFPHRAAMLCFLCLTIARIASAQCPIHQEERKPALTVVILGNLLAASGHYLPFRDFSASDGSTGRLVMADFTSLDAARQQINEWSKEANEITCREQYQNEGAQQISERLLAQGISRDGSKTKIFLTIRRDGLHCYFIKSSSIQVAKQIESLIDQTKDSRTPSP
jgi:hypothetical protein